jgi:hypothetical protein
MDRRSWLQLIGVLSAARAGYGQQAPAAPPQRVTREQVAAALQLLGLPFSEAEIKTMLPGVNRALAGFEALRKVDIPLDTEPAFSFHPGLAGRNSAAGPARFRPTVRKAPAAPGWKSTEDLAFLPVAELAALVRARRVTSTDLTRMYLSRLKKYAPQLNCVITLTEDLALKQAAQADAEIRKGRYRGPLHGIPWGAKDLLATRGITPLLKHF